MKVENRKVSELIPYGKNAKKHDGTQIANVAESIKQYGFVQPLVVDKDGVIVIGHCRLLAAKKLRMKEVPCVCVDDLTPEQVAALRIVDNKSNESAWDMDLLLEELEEIDLSDFDFDFSLSGDEEEQAGAAAEGQGQEQGQENPYTMNISAPVYEIKGDCPDLKDLCDEGKAEELIQSIEAAGVDPEIKRFLTLAAYRHLKFDYGKIAEYYAHAPAEVQALFEDSALVIIDFDAAIRNGFTKLSRRIEELRNEEE